jgi:integrase
MTSSLRKQGDVFSLPVPKRTDKGDSEFLYFDEGNPKDRAHRLALRVRENGSRKWIYFYRWGGKQQRFTIGDASDDPKGWTLTKARGKAHELRAMVGNGENPKVERERIHSQATDTKTFKETVAAYLAKRQAHMKPRSYLETKRHLENHWSGFHKRGIHEIDADMVADRLKEIEADSGPVARNRARSSLSAMFAWAIGERYKHLKANPVDGTAKVEEGESRDRVLSDKELVAIWNAAPASGYGRIVRLLMLTGQRREEIGGLRWSEINTEKKQIELPPERTKNSRPHDVPLSRMAQDVLRDVHRIRGRDLVFGEGGGGYSGWSRSKSDLDAAAKVKPWRLHDLRRTCATGMADLGVQPHFIEAVLNHVSGHKAGVAGIYNRSTYGAEKRAALDLWAGHVELILAKAEGKNIVDLAEARA